MAKSLAEVYKKVVRCVDCGNLKIIDKVCICSTDNSYDKICVVENLADMWVIDSANIYKGHYHILGGTLNSNENYEQKNLLIESLVKRIKKNNLNLLDIIGMSYNPVLKSYKLTKDCSVNYLVEVGL